MDLEHVISDIRALLGEYSDTDIASELHWAMQELSELILQYDMEVERGDNHN